MEENNNIENLKNEMVENSDFSEVAQFYAGQTVLLTGCSGFVGKVILEKLLKVCPGIECIFVLMRPKKGYSPKERLKKLAESAAFEVLLSKNPNAFNKVKLVEGDLFLPNFGLSRDETAVLAKQVTVVLHCAASVRFKETLRQTLLSNVVGTYRVLSLCHQLPNLVSMVHVSTAYSNCVRPDLKERIYPQKFDPYRIIELTEWMDDSMLEKLAPCLVGDYPNYYTYSKGLAEALVAAEAKSLPVAIVRPSIVVTCVKDPFPGWGDSLIGPGGLIVAIATGLLQSLQLDLNLHPDGVPCDFVANTVICAAYHRAKQNNSCGVSVFNSVTGPQNRITFKHFNEVGLEALQTYPTIKLIRYPKMSYSTSKIVSTWRMLVYHRLVYFLLDQVLQIFGEKPFLTRIFNRCEEGIEVMRYFFSNEWTFYNDQTRLLYKSLNCTDKDLFPMIHDDPWEDTIKTGYFGARRHLLNDDSKTLPAARRKLKILYVVSIVCEGLFILLLAYAAFWIGKLVLSLVF